MPSIINGSDNFNSGYMLGVGQTWQDVTASRALSTTYTNSTGKPIQVSITVDTSANSTYGSAAASKFYINGLNVGQIWTSNSSNTGSPVTFIVPNGATYSVSASTLRAWFELR